MAYHQQQDPGQAKYLQSSHHNTFDARAADATPESDVAILEPLQLEGQLIHGEQSASAWGAGARENDSPLPFEAMGELRKTSRVLTLSLVLPICYFLSCSGPRGIEPAISTGGPLLGLVAILVYPLVFSLPLSMIVAELCTAFPDDGGYVIWVKNAFGPFWGFQQGFWAWVSSNLVTASVPAVIVAGLKDAFGAFKSPVVEYLVKVAIAMTLSLPTLFGVKLVARTAMLFWLFVLVPTLLLVIKCFSQADHFDKLTEIRKVNSTSLPTTEVIDVDWKGLLTAVFWKYDGIYFVSLFGGQVANPAFTYPRVVFINLALMVLTYAVPSVAMVAADKLDWHLYEGGTILDIAKLTGGSFLHGFELMSVICSNAGMFLVTTFATCYQVNGMAENALIPEVFSKRHYFFETPYYALLLNVVPVMFLMAFDLDVLVQSANCFSAFVQILIFASALKLRVAHGDIYRPSKVPGGIVVVCLLMIIPFIVLVFVIATAFTGPTSAIISGVLMVVGVLYAKCIM